MNINFTRNITFYLFISIFFSALLWLAIIPMWHTPDEQAHFSQVAFLAEKGRNPGGGALDTTEEIFVSEQLLGTSRDKVGNNKFTFHPEYNIEYTNTLFGKYEASISALTYSKAKNKLVYTEASYYPKPYYIPAAWLFKLFYSSDLFTRLYITRGWSLLLFMLNIFIVYKIGQIVFSDNKLRVAILTILVGFHPMMIFANIGVNSDSLGNLLFTLFLYSSLRIIILGLSLKEIILLVLSAWLALSVKIQFVIIVPSLLILLSFLLIRDVSHKSKWIFLLFLLFIAIFIFINPYSLKQVTSLSYAANYLKDFNLPSYLKYTHEYTLSHTFNEVIPWFWGVYKWLGITYPRLVYKIINRISLISLVGVIVWFIQLLFSHKWVDKKIQGIIFIFFTFIMYYFALSVYDWLSWYKSGFQLGIQGRYYFPFISILMIILFLGWVKIFPNKLKLKVIGIKILGILMILLDLFSIYYISSKYYNVNSLHDFIIQASQYKPWFLKGNSLLIIILFAFVSSILLILQILSLGQSKKR